MDRKRKKQRIVFLRRDLCEENLVIDEIFPFKFFHRILNKRSSIHHVHNIPFDLHLASKEQILHRVLM